MENNIIFVGEKPTMTYVFAVTTQAENQNKIIIKARGRVISKAVDIALISINKYCTTFNINEINVGTDEYIDEKQDKIRVSFIEIILKHGDNI